MGDHKIAIVISTITKFVKTQKFRIRSENTYCKERLNKVFERKILIKEFAKVNLLFIISYLFNFTLLFPDKIGVSIHTTSFLSEIVFSSFPFNLFLISPKLDLTPGWTVLCHTSLF